MTTQVCRKDVAATPVLNKPQRLVTGWISTIDVDMDGDVVLPHGMKDTRYFETTRSVNLCHNPDAAVGVNRNLAVRSKGIYATTYISKTPLGEDVMTMIQEGVLQNFSIEWDPTTLIASAPTKEERMVYGEGCKNVFRSWELTRYALTPRPCNPKCVVDGIKDSRAFDETWGRMEALFEGGKISRASAVACGFPDTAERKAWSIPKPRRALYVDGAVVVR